MSVFPKTSWEPSTWAPLPHNGSQAFGVEIEDAAYAWRFGVLRFQDKTKENKSYTFRIIWRRHVLPFRYVSCAIRLFDAARESVYAYRSAFDIGLEDTQKLTSAILPVAGSSNALAFGCAKAFFVQIKDIVLGRFIAARRSNAAFGSQNFPQKFERDAFRRVRALLVIIGHVILPGYSTVGYHARGR